MVTVFLADSDMKVREKIRQMTDWGREGIRFIGEAGDGEAAYPLIRKLKPDILITDMQMPYMDGLSLCGLVRQELAGVKFIITSERKDFQSAQKAINLGVEGYLVKPVTRSGLMDIVRKISADAEKEKEARQIIKDYRKAMDHSLQAECRELLYEVITERVSAIEAFQKSRKLGIDLAANAYCMLLFRITPGTKYEAGQDYKAEAEVEELMKKQQDVFVFKTAREEWLFLFKGESVHAVMEKTGFVSKKLMELMDTYEGMTYFGGISRAAQRLGDLKKCYTQAERAFAGRFFIEANHIVTYEGDYSFFSYMDDRIDMSGINFSQINGTHVKDFIKNGVEEEIPNFLEKILLSIGEEAIHSLTLRNYILTDIYMKTFHALEELGADKKIIAEHCGNIRDITSEASTIDRFRRILDYFFHKVFECRKMLSEKKNPWCIEAAKIFIADNYMHENISLSTVAGHVDLNPGYFSALFSQEMGTTFIEYLTDIRIEKARELLLHTDIKIKEICNGVGYKDSHYFSQLFRKLVNCTPSEYRKRGRNKE